VATLTVIDPAGHERIAARFELTKAGPAIVEWIDEGDRRALGAELGRVWIAPHFWTPEHGTLYLDALRRHLATAPLCRFELTENDEYLVRLALEGVRAVGVERMRSQRGRWWEEPDEGLGD
jgi:hypothetical protein